MFARSVRAVRQRTGRRRSLARVGALAAAFVLLVAPSMPAHADRGAGTPPNAARHANVAVDQTWVWGSLHAGDCQQDNGTVVIRSDGTGEFSADTLTYHTHSGDIWHTIVKFYTTAGFYLFSTPSLDSPRMDDGNPPPRYHWTRSFVFNPSHFSNVGQVYQFSSC